ncbi:MAG: ABC transporter substrate-binding protein [Porticoccaceae bacterium]
MSRANPCKSRNWFVGRKLLRRLLVSLLLALLLLSGWAQAGENPVPDTGIPVSLRLKWFHQFQFAGYYAALEKGFFAEEGLDVKILERDPETFVMDDVVSGKVDFGVADSSLIVSRMNGKPVVLINPIFQHSPMVLISLAEKNILGPADLAGKKVMYQLDQDDAVIIATLNEAGLGQEDIISVQHGFDDWALLNSDIDAMASYLSNQPFRYRDKGIKINILDPANYGIDFYGDNLFTSEAMIQRRPEVVEAFRRATLRGWLYALDHSGEVVDLILQKYSTVKSRAQLEYEAQIIRRMIQPDLIDIGMINHHRFERIANIYKERGRVPKDANLEGFFADEYLGEPDIHSVFLHRVVQLAIFLLVLSALMAAHNRHLKKVVARKTRDADDAREKAERYLEILDRHTCVLRVDEQFRIQHLSSAFSHLGEYVTGQLVGKPHTLLMDAEKSSLRLRQLVEAVSSGRAWHGELQLKKASGDMLVMEVFVEPVMNDRGEFAGYNAVCQDMTQKKNAELLSITDTLTGLYNRNKIDALLVKESKLVQRGSPAFSVILLDIDHFKLINDKHGHLMGDQVLRQFARSIKRNVRETDLVGRWGGEEFMVICANTSLIGAETLAEMLRATIERSTYPEHIRVTSSFGVAEYVPGESLDDLIKRADDCLYQAKNSGRNCVKSRVLKAVSG